MNNRSILVSIIAAAFVGIAVSQLFAAAPPTPGKNEYVTIRWGGRDNTHVIRPGGNVEFVREELRRVEKPDRTDERSFYMNVVMNGLVKEGYEFAGMTSDDIVMKREIR